MADKYHINPETGNPNKCYAKQGRCPFGSDENHFPTKAEARSAYEGKMAEQAVVSQKREKDAAKDSRDVHDEAEEDGWVQRDPAVHEFQSDYLPEYIDRIEKANRRLEKFGIKERFEYEIEEYHVKERNDENDLGLAESYTRLTLKKPTIALEGNKFLAVVSQEEAGFITRTATDVELGGWRPESMKCDHCGINRSRSTTYIVEDKDGNRLQIGSSCVDGYLGVKPEGLWAIGADILDGMNTPTRNSSAVDRSRSAEDMIAYGLAVSNEGETFVSRSSAQNYGGTATADEIESVLWSRDKWSKEWREEVTRKAAEYKASGKAREVLEEIRKIEGDSDYATNLRTVANSEYINPRNSGILVSGLSVYRKKIQKAKRDAEPKPTSGFAAPVDTKIKGMKATVTNVSNHDSYDSYRDQMVTRSKVTFRDEDGHQMIWWASKVIDVEPGTDVTFNGGSVKKHDHYNGVDQTVLTRVKI